jgi:type II secretory pathway component PulK
MIKDLKQILQNQRGVALMMIMTAIILLMAIYGEFTFESKISRIKATNIMDRSQAKLLAESGLQLAITRLKLYKEAFNKIQGNQNAAQMVSSQLLNQLWEVPFIFPIPVGANANRAFLDTVDKFTKETLLEGEMKVSIQNISNRMNLNMLRIDMTKFNPEGGDGQEYDSRIRTDDLAISEDVHVDQSLFFLLKKMVDEKKEKDEAFEARYSSINYQEMVTTLKYFMSDYMSMNNDPLMPEAERNFQEIKMAPKYGPLGSASELYAIPLWNDELIELVQNEFSVYPSTQIDFNKITANMLKLLVPSMTDENIKEFYEYRDNPQAPKFINTVEEFKKFLTSYQVNVTDAQFDDRIKKFQAAGVSFGSNPNLFKVVSEGTYNRSNYTLVAYVVLPKNEPQKPQGGQQCPVGQIWNTTVNPPGCQPDPNYKPATTAGAGSGAPAQNAQLLEPRIIEIQIN